MSRRRMSVMTVIFAIAVATSVTPAPAGVRPLLERAGTIERGGTQHGSTERGSPAVDSKQALPLTGKPLPIGRMFDMVVASDRIYMSGLYDDLVVATDYSGHVTSTMPVNGPDGLVYRTGTLYVAAWSDGTIRRYDASTDPPTFQAAYPATGVAHPETLEFAGGRLWYSGDCNASSTNFGSMALDGTDAAAWEPSGGVPSGCPELRSDPNAPRYLMMGYFDVYDSTTDPPMLEGSLEIQSYGGAVTPDGNHVIVANWNQQELREYTYPQLTGPTRTWPASNPTGYAIAVTDAGGGLIAASGDDFDWPDPSLLFYSDDESQPIRAQLVLNPDFWHSAPPSVYGRGLHYSPDGSTLFVVTGLAYEESWFHAFPATAGASHIEIDTDRRTITFGDEVLLTASLAGGSADASLAAYQISSPGFHKKLQSAVIDDAGVAQIHATPSSSGWLLAGYGGDADWLPAESGWVDVNVRVLVSSRMIRPDHVDGRYAVYRSRQDVVDLTVVRPEKTGFVRVHLEVNVGGGWRNGGSDSFRLRDSRVAIGFQGGTLPAGRYRLTSSYNGDEENLGNDSGWTYFRVS